MNKYLVFDIYLLLQQAGKYNILQNVQNIFEYNLQIFDNDSVVLHIWYY